MNDLFDLLLRNLILLLIMNEKAPRSLFQKVFTFRTRIIIINIEFTFCSHEVVYYVASITQIQRWRRRRFAINAAMWHSDLVSKWNAMLAKRYRSGHGRASACGYGLKDFLLAGPEDRMYNLPYIYDRSSNTLHLVSTEYHFITGRVNFKSNLVHANNIFIVI